jgi:biopolymer transport protein ExbD
MISGINMTPLVDIMLVLLIIFLVTAKLSYTPPNAIPMNLPKASTGDGVALVIAIALGKNGEIMINNKRLANDDALLGEAKSEHALHPDARAVINADGKVLHERIIHVLSLLAEAGVTQIAFGVDLSNSPEAGGPAP